jgi:tRNA nucleotidyltransferase/poly(A) polymerase
MQRLTDQEIVQWLHDEKKIDVGRSTVTTIKNQVERHAEEWYLELRDSGAKYIAIYKERLDSLLSYQKKLHEIINQVSESSPELVLRAISELHKIEVSLHTLMKELPGDIKTSKDKNEDRSFDI